jgi:phosphatidylinositol glycan class B
MRLLTSTVLFTLTIWSCIGHKEWRFLHPLLPILLLYPARYLVDRYQPPDGGLWVSYITCAYSFVRVNRRPFLFLVLAPILPYVYLSGFHGRAQIEVTDWLRRRAVETPAMSVLFVTPCHSTPWMSHIHLEAHRDEARWHFLTCEPPLR